MSEASLNIGDEERAVVGEPVSHPHQAAVVGEPVPLANGLQKDQQLAPSSSSDELSTTNGAHDDISLAAEPPSQSRDAPSSADSALENPSSSSAPALEEHSVSQEAGVEEGTHESASENLTPPRDALDSPYQEAFDSTSEAKPDADAPADAEITHIADIPTQPSRPGSEISTENPFSALDEASSDIDFEDSVEDVATEEPVAVDQLTERVAVPGDTDETPVRDEDASTADAAEPLKDLAATASNTHEEPTTEYEEKNLNTDASEETKDSEHFEVNTAEPQQVNTSITEEIDSGSAGNRNRDSGIHPLSTRDAKVQEDDAAPNVEDSAEEGEAPRDTVDSTEVGSRKAAQTEVAPSIKASAAEGEDQAAPDAVDSTDTSSGEVKQVVSSEADEKVFSKDDEEQAAPQGQVDDNGSAKVYPTESAGTRAMSAEECTDGTALGENGFQHGQDDNPLERERGPTKEDDTESAEVKEKPSSGLKLPLIFATLAIAVVGVAVTSFSRARH